jgi:hypothetical protein
MMGSLVCTKTSYSFLFNKEKKQNKGTAFAKQNVSMKRKSPLQQIAVGTLSHFCERPCSLCVVEA